jgi:hypothetical protein
MAPRSSCQGNSLSLYWGPLCAGEQLTVRSVYCLPFLKIVDNLTFEQDWNPELPEYVGIFHAYTRGFNQDARQHKLFIITSGGCNMLCDQYFNMCLDVNEVSTEFLSFPRVGRF